MRNRRLLILIGLVVVVGGLAAALLLPGLLSPGDGEGADVTPTPTPIGTTPIVVSAQEIGRGQELSPGAVALQDWPVDALPIGAIIEAEDVYGMIAKVDIPRGMPIVESMVGYQAAAVVGPGSPASWLIPEGKVAYALPVSRYTSVAWAIQPGDHVDVLLSVLLVDLDEEFQGLLPNYYTCAEPTEEGECPSGPLGRFEVLPTGLLVVVYPNEGQRPRMVTQMTIVDAVVMNVGDWEEPQTAPEEAEAGGAAETGDEAAAEQDAQAAPQVQAAEQSVTLAVTRQEAAILEFAQMNNIRVTLVLRSAQDEGSAGTDPVTLQYLLDRYAIEVPPSLPYGVEPAPISLPVR